ncbi:hypothetical protein [Peribacillus frigoritolerans]|uniref:Uncharacterized protein n=1 Tax=Peribacillus castrilensis TaxID=2897690 RepID=A0AAW9N5Z9_9BACI|nr:hypothetical protein [Peribacillus castrilensis]
MERKVRDSCGKSASWETPQALAPRRLPDRPRKASACSGNQRFFLQTLKKDVSASFLQSVEGFIKQEKTIKDNLVFCENIVGDKAIPNPICLQNGIH